MKINTRNTLTKQLMKNTKRQTHKIKLNINKLHEVKFNYKYI